MNVSTIKLLINDEDLRICRSFSSDDWDELITANSSCKTYLELNSSLLPCLGSSGDSLCINWCEIQDMISYKETQAS